MNAFSVFFAVFMALAIAQRAAETFAKRDVLPGKRCMRWSLSAMVTMHLLAVAATVGEFVYLRRWETPVLWAAGIGLCLYAGSVVLRNMAIRALGRFWSLHVEVREQHALVSDGVYGWVRHPAYLAIWVEVISVPLVANAFYTAAVFGVVYLVFLLYRISVEEKAMTQQLGERYREYQRRVPALLPVRLPFCGTRSRS